MAKLTIIGDYKQLSIIVKQNRLRTKRHGFKISLNKDKTQEIEKSPELTAKEVAELIVKCETVEDLKKYEADTRQVVKAAYNKKLKELE